jgi:hypothetical protein
MKRALITGVTAGWLLPDGVVVIKGYVVHVSTAIITYQYGRIDHVIMILMKG